jgi:hypothetical protein
MMPVGIFRYKTNVSKAYSSTKYARKEERKKGRKNNLRSKDVLEARGTFPVTGARVAAAACEGTEEARGEGR